jgi:hypothetical protein
MVFGRALIFATLVLVIILALPASGQSVISTRSGVLHFFEGSVYLGDQRLEPRLGRFPNVPEGAELSTQEGRAEVLLTPGVFLRIGDSSAIRMLATSLADTRVELEKGSAIIDSGEPNRETSVKLIYKDWQVHFVQKGVYRIDSNPPRLWVFQGKANVRAGSSSQPVVIERGNYVPFAAVLVPEPVTDQPRDALSNWEKGRSESIVADNAINSQIDEDPAAAAAGQDAFTYFPMLGVPSMGSMSGSPGYSSLYPYQPGFNSIYLPGYTYQPLLIGLMGRPYRMYSPGIGTVPIRIGTSPGIGTYTPTALPSRPIGRPLSPIGIGAHASPIHSAPVPAAPVHAAPHAVGGHVGGGRR